MYLYAQSPIDTTWIYSFNSSFAYSWQASNDVQPYMISFPHEAVWSSSYLSLCKSSESLLVANIPSYRDIHQHTKNSVQFYSSEYGENCCERKEMWSQNATQQRLSNLKNVKLSFLLEQDIVRLPTKQESDIALCHVSNILSLWFYPNFYCCTASAQVYWSLVPPYQLSSRITIVNVFSYN